MTNITMKAVDTLHISAVKPDNILPGEEFEVPGHTADDLEKRGLATRVGAAPEPEEKAEPELISNKQEPAPANKATAKPKADKAK